MSVDHAGAIVALTRRCRRRIGALRALACLSWAAPLGLIGVAGAFRLFPASAAATSVLAGAALVSVVAAGYAVWRPPGLRDAAALLDHRLSLDNYMVAALDLVGGPDAVAGLVARGAWQRVRTVKPRDAFPLDLTRPAIRMVCGLAIAAVIWPGFRPPSKPESQVTDTSADSFASGFRPARPPSDRQAQLPAVAGSPGVPPPPATSGAPHAAPLRPREKSLAQDAAIPLPRAAREAATGDGAHGSGPGSERGLNVRSADSAAAAAGAGSPGAPSASRGRASGSTGGPSSGSPTGDGQSVRGAGGVGSAPVQASAGGNPSALRDAKRRFGAPAPTGSRLERAMAGGEIPPRLRPYVRDYFVALGTLER